MDLGLKGKTALVTGGSKGIGRAVAEALAAEGCALHLAARTEADLARAQGEIEAAHGVAVAIHPLDLSLGDNARRLAAAVGEIDILVNNAGAIPGGDIVAVDEATWRRAWDLKVHGYINLIREIYPAMCARGRGVIVNVIGNAGARPRAGYIAGSVGNAGLMALTLALGAESLDHGVRVVAINPGPIETERLVALQRTAAERELGDAERWRELMKRLPAGRPGTPEECAQVVAFLASERASWISGCVIPVDGGGGAR